jgi:hypothetical protein
MALSASEHRALFVRHLRAFNHGVRTGDFSSMLGMYHLDAIFELADPVSITHRGLHAIRRAYRGDPPHGIMRICEPEVHGHTVVADYIWDAEPDRIAGQLALQFDGDRIVREHVTFAAD